MTFQTGQKRPHRATETHCANGHPWTAASTRWDLRMNKLHGSPPSRRCKVCELKWKTSTVSQKLLREHNAQAALLAARVLVVTKEVIATARYEMELEFAKRRAEASRQQTRALMAEYKARWEPVEEIDVGAVEDADRAGGLEAGAERQLVGGLPALGNAPDAHAAGDRGAEAGLAGVHSVDQDGGLRAGPDHGGDEPRRKRTDGKVDAYSPVGAVGPRGTRRAADRQRREVDFDVLETNGVVKLVPKLVKARPEQREKSA